MTEKFKDSNSFQAEDNILISNQMMVNSDTCTNFSLIFIITQPICLSVNA